MSNNAAPDSWDDTDVADMSNSDLQQKLTKLNVNAMEFVPSFSSFSTKPDDSGGQGVETAGDADEKSTSKCTGFKVMTC